MQRRFLFVALVFVLGFAGVWIYLANKFEKLVENDIKPLLERETKAFSISSDGIKLDKYRFKFTLEGIKIPANSSSFGAELEKIEASYNPFKDIITLKPLGDKVQLRIFDQGGYIKDPRISVIVDRSIFGKGLSDRRFEVLLKIEDFKFFSLQDELLQESKESIYKLIHSKNGDNHDLELFIDGNGSLIHKLDSSFFRASSEILSPEVFENMEKNLIGLSKELSKYPISDKIKISVSDALFKEILKKLSEESLNSQKLNSKLGEFAIDVSLKFGPTGVFDFHFKIDSSESQFDVLINKNGEFFPKETYPYLAGYLLSAINAAISQQGLMINQDAVINYLQKNSEVNKWSLGINFNKNLSHDLVVTHDDKSFKIKGNIDDQGMILKEKIEFDNILGYMAYKKSFINEVMDMFASVSDKPEDIAKTQHYISKARTSVNNIYPPLVNFVKLLNKGDKSLAEGDKFELEGQFDIVRFVILTINENTIDDFLKNPKVIEGIRMLQEAIAPYADDKLKDPATNTDFVSPSSLDSSAKNVDEGPLTSDPYLEDNKPPVDSVLDDKSKVPESSEQQ